MQQEKVPIYLDHLISEVALLQKRPNELLSVTELRVRSNIVAAYAKYQSIGTPGGDNIHGFVWWLVERGGASKK